VAATAMRPFWYTQARRRAPETSDERQSKMKAIVVDGFIARDKKERRMMYTYFVRYHLPYLKYLCSYGIG
jgi:hypothetical protein